MIISDSKRFVFIHIPKCGGTSVRQQLSFLDERGGAYEARIYEHPAIGATDFVHLPLATLKAFFPEEYERVQSYRSFAILREPHERFQSAVAQFCNYQTDTPFKLLSTKALETLVRGLADRLESQAARLQSTMPLPPPLIHFQPQRDYIFCGEQRIVQTITPIDELYSLEAELQFFLGHKVSFEEKANQSLYYKSERSRRILNAVNRITPAPGRFIPSFMRIFLGRALYDSKPKAVRDLFESDFVVEFVESFYANDLVLWQQRKEL